MTGEAGAKPKERTFGIIRKVAGFSGFSLEQGDGPQGNQKPGILGGCRAEFLANTHVIRIINSDKMGSR